MTVEEKYIRAKYSLIRGALDPFYSGARRRTL
jgi:hypothetical protein